MKKTPIAEQIERHIREMENVKHLTADWGRAAPVIRRRLETLETQVTQLTKRIERLEKRGILPRLWK